MDKESSIQKLEQLRDSIDELRTKSSSSPEFTKWRRDTRVAVTHVFGEKARHVAELEALRYGPLMEQLDSTVLFRQDIS